MSLPKVYTADIFETPELFQSVHYYFEAIMKKRSFFEDGGDLYEVNSLELKTPLGISPSDIEADLETAIRSELNLTDFDVVKIVCEIEYCEPVEKTVFDLRQHSQTDLNRLDMAINTGIVQCHGNDSLREMKETLLAYQSLVNQAMKIVSDREGKEWVDQQMKEIFNK